MNAENIIRKYYPRKEEAFSNLIVHSEMVRRKALQILDHHKEIKADREFIEEAAMLHDIGIIFTHAPSIGCHGDHPYICHGYIGAELLRKEGYPEHAKVCERHTGTGLTKEEIISRNLPIPPAEYTPESTAEILICYADKFYSKGQLTKPLSVEKIIDGLSRFGEDKKETFLRWHSIFGL